MPGLQFCIADASSPGFIEKPNELCIAGHYDFLSIVVN